MNKIIFSFVVILALVVLASNNKENHIDYMDDYIIKANAQREKKPPCMQMYYSIEKYSKKFRIPKKYAYGIAYKETGYRGPFHWDYNHKRISSAGALGPMQIMISTAGDLNNEVVSREKLISNIEYNVMTSMKLMRKLYNLRGDWGLALGEYNTGNPCINNYAIDILNINFKWENYE